MGHGRLHPDEVEVGIAKTETEVFGQGELRSDSSVRGELHASGVLARALDVRATTQKFMPLLA